MREIKKGGEGMKKKLEMCQTCKEETFHMVGKKQAHKGDSHYIRRSTSECTKCGRKEINNKIKGKRIISRRNESSIVQEVEK